MINTNLGPRYHYYISGYNSNTPQFTAFKCAVGLYTGADKDVSVLQSIRDIPGYSKCWGYAQEIIKKNSAGRGDSMTEELKKLYESLIKRMLEILPAYDSWVPSAYIPENQPLIAYLNERCNMYRTSGNPKYYAYDTVMENLAITRVKITVHNYKYIKGVGPKMSRHICTFLTREIPTVIEWPMIVAERGITMNAPSSVRPPSDPVIEHHLNMLEKALAGNFKALATEIVTSGRVPMLAGDFMQYSFFDEAALKVLYACPSADSHCPIAKNWVNNRLVGWLWDQKYYTVAKLVAAKSAAVSDPSIIKCTTDIRLRISTEVFGSIMPEYTSAASGGNKRKTMDSM